MANRDQKKIDKVSKKVRAQYDNLLAQTLNEQKVLPESPVLTPHPAYNPADQTKLPPLKKRNRVVDILFFTIILFLIAVLTSAVLQRYYVGSAISVSGTSMDPSYKSGTDVWVDKTRTPKRGDIVVLYAEDVDSKFLAEFAFGSSTKSGGKYEKLIKRVIAFEGDALWVEKKDGNYVLVIKTAEGEILREDYYTVPGKSGSEAAVFHNADGHLDSANPVYVPYLESRSGSLGILTGTTEENPFIVAKGEFFYMGDNRPDSQDSRSIKDGVYIGDVPVDRIVGVVTYVIRYPK